MTVTQDYPDQVITLVHGTFANNAAWVREKSFFSEELSKYLAKKHIILNFNWSGKNSHTARLKAGEDLHFHLLNVYKKHPNAEQILIAHSHGGNVALYAIKFFVDIPFRFKLITLSTPFIDVKKRELNGVVSILKFISPILLFIIIFPLISLLVLAYCEDLSTHLWFTITVSLSIFTAVILIYIHLRMYLSKIHKLSDNIFNKINASGNSSYKSLSIIFSRDEAGMLLSSSSFLSKQFFRTYEIFHNIWLSIIEHKQKYINLILFIGVMITYVVAQLVYLIIFLSILTAISFAIILCVNLFVKSNPLAFGWESFSHIFLVEESISPYPTHLSDNVSKVYDQTDDNFDFLMLRHSMPYMSKLVIKDVSEWVNTN